MCVMVREQLAGVYSFFPPTTWVPGMEFGSSGLGTSPSTLSHLADPNFFCVLRTLIHFRVVCLDSEQSTYGILFFRRVASFYMTHRDKKQNIIVFVSDLQIGNLTHKEKKWFNKKLLLFFCLFVLLCFVFNSTNWPGQSLSLYHNLFFQSVFI